MKTNIKELVGITDVSTLQSTIKQQAKEIAKLKNKPDTDVDVDLPKPEFGRLPLKIVDSEDWLEFGICGDTHLCCKEERLAELHCYYDLLAREGITQVFHAGNIVDGYIPKINGDSVLNSTIDGQCQYVIDNYPRRKGITTYFITGDDHEGWWQKQGFNFGGYLSYLAKDQGRTDLQYIGHIEADIELVGKNPKCRTIIKIQHPGGGSAYARSYTGQKQVECVPLDSEILTSSGWKKYTDLVKGEKVLGYNAVTSQCEWTDLLNIHIGRGEVSRYENDQFSVVCTPQHKWAQEVEQRAGPNMASLVPKPYSRKYQELAPIGHTKRRARIIQVAPAPSGPGLGTFDYTDWLRRPLASTRVMLMTSGERRAFIEGLLIAEGTRGKNKHNDFESVVFAQNTGPVLDAFRLACTLEGIATTEHKATGGSFKPEVTHARRVTVSAKTKRMCNPRYLKVTSLGETDVWCPTTGLGTWVMRQGTTITITGNSMEGGEKPAILIQGHYHVSNYMNDRNIAVVSLPGFQDQTIFARKKRLRMEVGGGILGIKRNLSDGAVTRCRVEFVRYFTRGYYKAYLKSDSKILKGHLVIK